MSRPTSRPVEPAGPPTPRQSCQKTPRPGRWNAGDLAGWRQYRSPAAPRTGSGPHRLPVTSWATVGMQSHSVKSGAAFKPVLRRGPVVSPGTRRSSDPVACLTSAARSLALFQVSMEHKEEAFDARGFLDLLGEVMDH